MPALPLDDAGPYVAAAYLVFLALILIYVAIMAAKLVRIARELGELTQLVERRDQHVDRRGGRADERDGAAMTELLALGASHKTAPLALRERIALTERGAEPLLRELIAHDGDRRGGRALHLQPHRALPRRRRPGRGRVGGARRCSPGAPASGRPSCSTAIYSLRNCDAARHLYRVPAGLESMIVGEAEVQGQVKRAYEAALAAAHDRADDQQAVPRRARHRQARAHRDGDLGRPRQRRLRRRRRRAATRSATWPSGTC